MDEYLTIEAPTLQEFDFLCNKIAKDGFTPCFPLVIVKMKTETGPIQMTAIVFVQQWRRPIEK